MVSKLRLLVAIALCLPLVGAWPNTGKKYPSVVVAYSGPGDIVSGAEFYVGFRGYNLAYATGSNPAATIRRASDNTTQVLNILTSGAIDNATANTFCSSTTCFVTKLDDQSGGTNCSSSACNLTQSTAADQPQYTFNCINGTLPCMAFNGSTDTIANTSAFTINIPYTTIMLLEANGATATGVAGGCGSNCANPISDTGGANTNTLGIYGGGGFANATATDGAFHAWQGVGDGGSSVANVDGTSTSGSTSNAGPNVTIDISDNGGGSFVKMDATEYGTWTIGFNSTQLSNMHTNMKNYWGTP